MANNAYRAHETPHRRGAFGHALWSAFFTLWIRAVAHEMLQAAIFRGRESRLWRISETLLCAMEEIGLKALVAGDEILETKLKNLIRRTRSIDWSKVDPELSVRLLRNDVSAPIFDSGDYVPFDENKWMPKLPKSMYCPTGPVSSSKVLDNDLSAFREPKFGRGKPSLDWVGVPYTVMVKTFKDEGGLDDIPEEAPMDTTQDSSPVKAKFDEDVDTSSPRGTKRAAPEEPEEENSHNGEQGPVPQRPAMRRTGMPPRNRRRSTESPLTTVDVSDFIPKKPDNIDRPLTHVLQDVIRVRKGWTWAVQANTQGQYAMGVYSPARILRRIMSLLQFQEVKQALSDIGWEFPVTGNEAVDNKNLCLLVRDLQALATETPTGEDQKKQVNMAREGLDLLAFSGRYFHPERV